jgi:hypothetical protein
MTPSTLRSLGFVAAAVALVAMATAFSGCSDSSSPTPATGQPAATGASAAGANSPEDVARRAIQAMIDGDQARFLELVRPDQREHATLDDLEGCSLGRAQVLVEEPFEGRAGQARVTIVLEEVCGASRVGQPFTACYMDLVELSGEWYLEATSHCATV